MSSKTKTFLFVWLGIMIPYTFYLLVVDGEDPYWVFGGIVIGYLIGVVHTVRVLDEEME